MNETAEIKSLEIELEELNAFVAVCGKVDLLMWLGESFQCLSKKSFTTSLLFSFIFGFLLCKLSTLKQVFCCWLNEWNDRDILMANQLSSIMIQPDWFRCQLIIL